MTSDTGASQRPIDLSDSALIRFWQTFTRGLLRRCPYCGGSGIFQGWFTLRERCPGCNTLFAFEDGYFLGSYVINIGLTSLIAIAVVIWMLASTTLTTLQMQGVAVALAVGLPLLLYPFSLSFWMMLDLLIHPPKDFSDRPRR